MRNIFKNTTRILPSAALLCALFIVPSAKADQEQVQGMVKAPPPIVDIMPAAGYTETSNEYADADQTHPPIRLTPDKSEILNLNANAASIIIGNPNHLSILADAANRLVLVPRAAGATFFTILDHSGEVVMQRHAIIAAPKQEYVRIRRSCANGGDNCQETSVFYCPGMCHEIKMGSQGSQNGSNSNDLALNVSSSSSTGDTDETLDLDEPAE